MTSADRFASPEGLEPSDTPIHSAGPSRHCRTEQCSCNSRMTDSLCPAGRGGGEAPRARKGRCLFIFMTSVESSVTRQNSIFPHRASPQYSQIPLSRTCNRPEARIVEKIAHEMNMGPNRVHPHNPNASDTAASTSQSVLMGWGPQSRRTRPAACKPKSQRTRDRIMLRPVRKTQARRHDSPRER
jgi:hypothetical protein